MIHRIAFRISIALFLISVVGGLVGLIESATVVRGLDKFGIFIQTLTGCGVGFSGSFLAAVIAAWRIKAAWWLIAANIPFLVLLVVWLFFHWDLAG